MSHSKLRRSLSAFALAAAGVLGAAAPAQSAIVIGTFDPAFGAAIPNLGFRGTAQFSVPDACLALTGLIPNGDACSGNTMSVLSTQVEFYNLATPAVTLLTTNYPGASFNLTAINVLGGAVIGVDTGISLAASVSIAEGSGPGDVNFTGLLAGQFFTGLPATTTASGGFRMFVCDPSSEFECLVTATSNPARITYRLLPEPGSTGLVLAALGAAVLAVRRRRSGA